MSTSQSEPPRTREGAFVPPPLTPPDKDISEDLYKLSLEPSIISPILFALHICIEARVFDGAKAYSYSKDLLESFRKSDTIVLKQRLEQIQTAIKEKCPIYAETMENVFSAAIKYSEPEAIYGKDFLESYNNLLEKIKTFKSNASLTFLSDLAMAATTLQQKRNEMAQEKIAPDEEMRLLQICNDWPIINTHIKEQLYQFLFMDPQKEIDCSRSGLSAISSICSRLPAIILGGATNRIEGFSGSALHLKQEILQQLRASFPSPQTGPRPATTQPRSILPSI